MSVLAAGILCWLAANSSWAVARSPHFEVYSQKGVEQARVAAVRFEELRLFGEENHLLPAATEARKTQRVRVIGFDGKRKYDAVRLRDTADAYYTGTAERDYIVLPTLGPDGFRMAAHEYAHVLLHRTGPAHLPAWLSEGLAEVFSTVHINGPSCEVGGPLPARVESLRRHGWTTPAELFSAEADSKLRNSRKGAEIFYAESWAVADLLTFAPRYAGRLDEFTGKKMSAEKGAAILQDAREWIDQGGVGARPCVWQGHDQFAADAMAVSDVEARTVIADLLAANGDLGRAEQVYQELLREKPEDAGLLGAMGMTALRRTDRANAVEYWRKALARGLDEPGLCYRYALLAEELGLPAEEAERALERAIAHQPDFDDARYRLALLKSSQGEYAEAAAQFRQMGKPGAERAYGYWTALAYALSETGKREEAEEAAKQAVNAASTAEERAQAKALAYTAKTDLAVRFARDANGNLQMETTRVAHGATGFNPFVEAGDRMETVTGMLRDIQCRGGQLTAMRVESGAGVVTLQVPDPAHVLMRNGPAEFNCGAQTAKIVKAEVAHVTGDGLVLRGLEFQ